MFQPKPIERLHAVLLDQNKTVCGIDLRMVPAKNKVATSKSTCEFCNHRLSSLAKSVFKIQS